MLKVVYKRGKSRKATEREDFERWAMQLAKEVEQKIIENDKRSAQKLASSPDRIRDSRR